MPVWLSWILPVVLNLIAKYGIPEIEKRWPGLTPFLTEILAIFGGAPPSDAMKSAANHYTSLSAVAVAPEVKDAGN